MTTEIVEKKSNHRANVIRIEALRPHLNADSLSLIDIPGTLYQVVVRKGQFAVGDLAVYIQPDSVVPQTPPFSFIWEEHIGLDGSVPEKRRRITVRKFRKEISEGLLLPLSDFSTETLTVGPTGQVYNYLPAVGEDVSDRLGITHYDPDAGVEGTRAGVDKNAPKRRAKRPKTFKGWVRYLWYKLVGRGSKAEAVLESVPFTIPTYDVEALKNYANVFVIGEKVVVTEKIHGSNARFLYLDGTMYAGSRNQWKAASSNSTWHKALDQNPWIEQWCKDHEGYALYGEVTPTQKDYTYGCGAGDVKFFAFDIYRPDGSWVDFDNYAREFGFVDAGVKVWAPTLYIGAYDLGKIRGLVDGPSLVTGAKHIREGVVVKTAVERAQRGLGRTQLKLVSNEFLAKDGK